jgi:hypothetical protein
MNIKFLNQKFNITMSSLNLEEQIAIIKKQQEFLQVQLLRLEEKKMEKKIVQDTFDFFINKYEITPELKTIDFVNPSEKHYIIDGNIQSGKTKTLISFCVCSLAVKQKVVIIVRNFKEDCIQLINSINTINKIHNAYLYEKSNVSFNYEACSSKDLHEWMFEKHCNVLVLMANTTQLSTFAKVIVDNKYTDFTLFIDEADALMNTIHRNKEISVFNMMHIIFNQSKLAFLITATNYANIFKDGTLPSRFIKVKQHSNYKGIEDIEFEILPVLMKSKQGTLFEKSPSLYNVLQTLSHRPVYKNHPTILLTKCTHLVAHQTEFIETISTTKDWNARWTAIGYNGTGITLYHHSFSKMSNMTIDGVVGVKYNKTGIFIFKNIGIMKALTYLLENGGKEKFSRIVIISGHLASRCINFMDKEYRWHLTDEYLDPSSSMNCVDLIQSLRICGIHHNVTTLKVWCNEEVMNNIILTHYNLGGFIHQLADIYKDKNVDFKTILSSVKIHKNKLGNRKVCKVKAPYKKVSSEKQDNTNVILGISTIKNIETDVSWGLEMIVSAYENKNGLIHQIIQVFIENEYKSMSKTELDYECKSNLSITCYTTWNKQHNRYKLLILSEKNMYNLNPDVIKILNLL